jgi:ABC-type sugar transport system substrate-binding protein
MLKKLRFLTLISATAAALLIPFVGTAQAAKEIYYWVSHGSPTDPVWTLFLQGAEQWAKDTANDVRTSFHSGDVPSQQEAFRAAISAHARGIVTSTPDPGSMTKVISEAHAAGIPVIIMNTDDKASGRDAGEIPVVGWGNSIDTAQEVLDGYVSAAMWQDPQATSYMALSMASMAASGIPPGFDITVGTLYEKNKAATYLKIMQGSAGK